MPDTQDLELLLDAARAAGPVAMRYSRDALKSWDKPDNAGPVSEADLAVNRLLEEKLRDARPAYGWLSEESKDDQARFGCERVFVVDPIDGTRSFMSGSDVWAHALAVVEAGRVVAGVVALPERGELFWATAGGGAYLNGTPIRVGARGEADGAQVFARKDVLEPCHWPQGCPALKRLYRPTLAYRLCLVAQGHGDGMLSFGNLWEWDIAAGALIASEAGANVSDREGNALMFNTSRARLNGAIVAAPPLHRDLLQRMGRPSPV